jgi:hypothetical protein
MATDLFHNPKKEIPKNDERIVRVTFDHSEMGARKSHLATIKKGDNPYQIRHVNERG